MLSVVYAEYRCSEYRSKCSYAECRGAQFYNSPKLISIQNYGRKMFDSDGCPRGATPLIVLTFSITIKKQPSE